MGAKRPKGKDKRIRGKMEDAPKTTCKHASQVWVALKDRWTGARTCPHSRRTSGIVATLINRISCNESCPVTALLK